jgi:hypothetical protein
VAAAGWWRERAAKADLLDNHQWRSAERSRMFTGRWKDVEVCARWPASGSGSSSGVSPRMSDLAGSQRV